MKKCPNGSCARRMGEAVSICPYCGTPVDSNLEQIDDYLLLDLIRETAGGLIYRARKHKTTTDVLVRILPETSTYTPEQARRINDALQRINESKGSHLVRHIDLQQSRDGRWYRVSEWVRTTAWGDLTGSRFFTNPRNRQKWIDLFIRMATALLQLHKTGLIIPYLTFNDLLLYQDQSGEWQIKLDYKLFSQVSGGGPDVPVEIKKRMKLHPDIQNNRPFDFRSDIWSLGRLMLELLIDSDEFEDSQAMLDKIREEFKPIVLHRKLGSLLRAMVEDDPDKRPASMDLVLKSLEDISPEDISKWEKFSKDPTRQKKFEKKIRRYTYTAVGLIGLVFCLVLFYQHRQAQRRIMLADKKIKAEVTAMQAAIQGSGQYLDKSVAGQLATALVNIKDMPPEHKITVLTQKYRRSIAFVLVEPYLLVDGTKISAGIATGTAFLVSSKGHLLTNRHVACPWLTGGGFPQVFQDAAMENIPLEFGYNLYVWFDGDQAFRTAGAVEGSDEIEDNYRLDLAYSNHGNTGRTVSITGVMPFPQDVLEQLKGLQDDLAVLKVNRPPEDAVPIPLTPHTKVTDIPKGAPIIVLGYPYGRRSIVGEEASSRCTNGIITRVFDSVITTNAALHSGNSGGPVIDLNGFVLGITSAIFMDETRAGTSDMGQVYPVSTARPFLEQILGGTPKWQGIPVYVFESELNKARDAAVSGDQETTARTIKALTAKFTNDALFLWAGILISQGNAGSAPGRQYLKQCIQLDPKHSFAKFILYRADVMSGIPPERCSYRNELISLPWYDPDAIFCFLVQILENQVSLETAVQVGDSGEQAALINWTSAAAAGRSKNYFQARKLLEAALDLVEKESVLGSLIQLEINNSAVLRPPHNPAVPVKAGWKQPIPASPHEQRQAYIPKVFELAGQGKWADALKAIDGYLKYPHWESAGFLGMKLLYCQVLALDGRQEESKKELMAFHSGIKNAWYRTLARVLLGRIDEKKAHKSALKQRELILTLEFALGLKAEAQGNLRSAVQHYNNALDTCKTGRLEYALARVRREAVRFILSEKYRDPKSLPLAHRQPEP